MPGEPSPVRVGRSVARVLPPDGGAPVGLAFALDHRHVVTCAHVVNEALGHHVDDISRPADGDEVLLQVPATSGQPGRRLGRYACVAVWLPEEGRRWFAVRDVAVLELGEDLPDEVVRPPLLPGQSNGTVRMFGPDPSRHHEVHVDGELKGEVEADLLQVDERLGNVFRVEPGFSGGPVWRPETGEVVGMLVSGGRGRGPRDVYAIASDVLLRARTKAGITEPGTATAPGSPGIAVSTSPTPAPEPEPEPGTSTATVPSSPAPATTPPVPPPRHHPPGTGDAGPPDGRPRRPVAPVTRVLRPDLAPLAGRAREWLAHPLLLAMSSTCLVVALAISLTRVAPGWALLYGLRAGILVHLAGLAVSLATDLVRAAATTTAPAATEESTTATTSPSSPSATTSTTGTAQDAAAP